MNYDHTVYGHEELQLIFILTIHFDDEEPPLIKVCNKRSHAEKLLSEYGGYTKATIEAAKFDRPKGT